MYMQWTGFCERYRQSVERALSGNKPFEPIPEDIWQTGQFIGNLPNLRFTGMKVHQSAWKAGAPFFYFGKRFEREGKMLVPLYVMIDHRIADYYVLNKLIEDFEARILS